MQHIGSVIDSVLEETMLKSMLRPDNKDLYIKNLTKERLDKFLEFIQADDSFKAMTYRAYERAKATLPPEEPKQMTIWDIMEKE